MSTHLKEKKKLGFVSLAKKSLAIISALLPSLVSTQTEASPVMMINDELKNVDHESIQKKKIKSRLVLKLNVLNPEKSLASMHVSHSSHASHASHASSSSTYDSQPYTPPPPPSPPPTIHLNPSSNSIPITESLTQYALGSRILYEGCQGTDVQELQQLLLGLGYDVPTTGYFGDKTKAAIEKFQHANELNPDGKVGSTTLNFLKKK